MSINIDIFMKRAIKPFLEKFFYAVKISLLLERLVLNNADLLAELASLTKFRCHPLQLLLNTNK